MYVEDSYVQTHTTILLQKKGFYEIEVERWPHTCSKIEPIPCRMSGLFSILGDIIWVKKGTQIHSIDDPTFCVGALSIDSDDINWCMQTIDVKSNDHERRDTSPIFKHLKFYINYNTASI